jgi:hypothetical protein
MPWRSRYGGCFQARRGFGLEVCPALEVYGGPFPVWGADLCRRRSVLPLEVWVRGLTCRRRVWGIYGGPFGVREGPPPEVWSGPFPVRRSDLPPAGLG